MLTDVAKVDKVMIVCGLCSHYYYPHLSLEVAISLEVDPKR